jgi:hypothetical protein
MQITKVKVQGEKLHTQRVSHNDSIIHLFPQLKCSIGELVKMCSNKISNDYLFFAI